MDKLVTHLMIFLVNFKHMKKFFFIIGFLMILFSCRTNKREISIYSRPTIINGGQMDNSQDDLLKWSEKLTPSERDSFVKYFFYTDREIKEIKEIIENNQ
jgi:hypothetical protein